MEYKKRRDLADKYLKGNPAFFSGNMGIIRLISEVQKVLKPDAGSLYLVEVLEDIKSVLAKMRRRSRTLSVTYSSTDFPILFQRSQGSLIRGDLKR